MVLTPARAMAWFAFPKDCTRFRFGRDRNGTQKVLSQFSNSVAPASPDFSG